MEDKKLKKREKERGPKVQRLCESGRYFEFPFNLKYKDPSLHGPCRPETRNPLKGDVISPTLAPSTWKLTSSTSSTLRFHLRLHQSPGFFGLSPSFLAIVLAWNSRISLFQRQLSSFLRKLVGNPPSPSSCWDCHPLRCVCENAPYEKLPVGRSDENF